MVPGPVGGSGTSWSWRRRLASTPSRGVTDTPSRVSDGWGVSSGIGIAIGFGIGVGIRIGFRIGFGIGLGIPIGAVYSGSRIRRTPPLVRVMSCSSVAVWLPMAHR